MNVYDKAQDGRIHELDSLRGLLAIVVAVGHLSVWTGHAIVPASFVLAVDFFFVLSGFVITASFSRARAKDKWAVEFAVKRAFRIFPGYLVAAALTIAVMLPLRGLNYAVSSGPDLLTGALLLQTTGLVPFDVAPVGDTAIGIAWTLSVEMWLGLIFFVAVAVFKFETFSKIVVLAICAIIAGTLIRAYSPSLMQGNYQLIGPVPTGVLRGVIGFSLGYLAFQASTRVPQISRPGLLEAVALGLVLILYVRFDYNSSSSVYAPYLSAILIFAIASGHGILKWVLGLKPLRLLGEWSFGIYIMHPIFVDVFKRLDLASTAINVGFYLLAVTAAAAALFIMH